MFVTVLAIAMAAFGFGSWAIARRRGVDGISRRAYGNRYTDAPGAHRTPRRTPAHLAERPFWAE